MGNTKQYLGFLKDSNGDNSSKRLAGCSLLAIGLLMALILFVLCIYRQIGDSHTALSIIEAILSIGGGLLGIGIFENLKFGDHK